MCLTYYLPKIYLHRNINNTHTQTMTNKNKTIFIIEQRLCVCDVKVFTTNKCSRAHEFPAPDFVASVRSVVVVVMMMINR